MELVIRVESPSAGVEMGEVDAGKDLVQFLAQTDQLLVRTELRGLASGLRTEPKLDVQGLHLIDNLLHLSLDLLIDLLRIHLHVIGRMESYGESTCLVSDDGSIKDALDTSDLLVLFFTVEIDIIRRVGSESYVIIFCSLADIPGKLRRHTYTTDKLQFHAVKAKRTDSGYANQAGAVFAADGGPGSAETEILECHGKTLAGRV